MIAKYQFLRDGSNGANPNRPSADAIGALSLWENMSLGRAYNVQVDQDDLLVANLSWSRTDDLAEAILSDCCQEFGVTCQTAS